MTRIQQLRHDARRVPEARRDRSAPAPARVTFPVLSAVAVITSTVVVSSILGLPLLAVLALTAVVAIAGACVAHRTVSNVLAGVLLLLVRPYGPGERLRLELPQPVDGELVRVGFVNTTLCTQSGLLTVPNSMLVKTSRQA
jgi:small-conductance mechanosensitive channel